MREYELTIIIQPEISEEGTQDLFERLDKILEDAGAIRLLCDDLGKRKLAYEIQKFHKGHYHILYFLDQGKATPLLERVLRMDESVLRFMTIVVNDNVVDIEGRRAVAKEREVELAKRAAERAAREAEEAKAREAEEVRARAEAEAQREAQAAAAEAEGSKEDDDSPAVSDEAVEAAEVEAPAQAEEPAKVEEPGKVEEPAKVEESAEVEEAAKAEQSTDEKLKEKTDE